MIFISSPGNHFFLNPYFRSLRDDVIQTGQNVDKGYAGEGIMKLWFGPCDTVMLGFAIIIFARYTTRIKST